MQSGTILQISLSASGRAGSRVSNTGRVATSKCLDRRVHMSYQCLCFRFACGRLLLSEQRLHESERVSNSQFRFERRLEQGFDRLIQSCQKQFSQTQKLRTQVCCQFDVRSLIWNAYVCPLTKSMDTMKHDDSMFQHKVILGIQKNHTWTKMLALRYGFKT